MTLSSCSGVRRVQFQGVHEGAIVFLFSHSDLAGECLWANAIPQPGSLNTVSYSIRSASIR